MKLTKAIYLSDSYLKETTAKIVNITSTGSKSIIFLDQTIFYPIGGGQPSDVGAISNDHGKAQVTNVKYNKGLIEHFCHIEGELAIGDTVTLTIDWTTRYRHMQFHTAGHILDEAVKEITPEFHGIEGMHGINNQLYVEFNGFIDSGLKDNIAEQINSYIQDNAAITLEMVTAKEIEQRHIVLPFVLPEDKPLRLITIGDHAPAPDGGTQLRNTSELWPITLGEFEYKDGHTLIHYHLDEPQETKTEPAHVQVAHGTISIEVFQQHAHELETAAKANPNEDYLGKKGKFNDVAKLMKDIAPENRAEAGKLLNELKQSLTEISRKLPHDQTISQSNDSWLDTTIPGELPKIGHLHPVTQAIDRITHIFETIGFTRVRYPEIDWDKYVFENLNMPKSHPARDEWETFFLDVDKDPEMGQMVLTTHTSNGQTREMERVGKPPIRMLNIGKCYRRQQDVTHTAMFHQFEGLVIDKGITIQHLKGVLDYFAKEFYGPAAKSRIRPFHFQFTEPSFEVDFSCVHCDGKGCRFCKSGWHEVGGAGMVHPNVLKAGGINPNEYTGFAFGWGIERVYTLQAGLQLDDIRLLYSDNVDFLRNF